MQHVSTSQRKHSRVVAHSPIYYGWILWAAATLGIIATAPGQSFTVSLFFDSFIEDFGLSRTTVSALYGMGTFAASLGLTWIGRQIDLRGNRFMGMIIAAGFSAVLVLFSTITGPFGLLLGFFAIRGLGQGSLSLVHNTAISTWFKRLRGRVMSMTVLSFALFQSIYVPWLQKQIEIYDWRQMWIVLGVTVGIVMLPVTYILIRNRPEDYGLAPDGGFVPETVDTASGLEDEINWTLKQAMRTPIFWVFICGKASISALVTGVIIHQVSLFEQVGYDAETAAQTYAIVTLMIAGFSFVFGYLIDKIRPGWVLGIGLTAQVAMLVLINLMTSPILLGLYALSLGMTMGGMGVFDAAVWPNLYGRAHQGAIRGFVVTGMVAGSSLGPVLFGFSLDYLGSYTPMLLFGAAVSGLLALASILVKEPSASPDPT